MTRKSNNLSGAYEKILLALATFLLKNGVGHKEFAESSKWAFYEAGKRALELKKEYTTNRLLEITGLSRNELSRVDSLARSGNKAADTVWISAMRVLHKWYTKNEFLDSTGKPKDLDLDDKNLFRSLFNIEVSDPEGENLLRELIESGSIKKKGELWQVESRYYIPKNKDLKLHYFGQAVSRLISTLDRNINQPDVDTWIDRVVSTTEIKPASKPLFTRVSKEQALKFLEGLDDWLSSNERDDLDSDQSEAVELGLGIYYFENDDQR